MTHIEDLKVDDFISTISRFNNLDISIKLDGTAAIAFGLDEDGRFYTGFGRDFKDIKDRFYSEQEYLERKNIFYNPAIAAHTLLKKNLDTIKQHIKNGETALAEVLLEINQTASGISSMR